MKKSQTRHPSKEASVGHNGGPPLDETVEKPHVPEWGKSGLGTYFFWKAARKKVWGSLPYDVVIRRQAKAEAVGLSYEEYTMEILERGRYLQPEDIDNISAVKTKRRNTRSR